MSGGPEGAAKGTLAIMCGGEQGVFDGATALLEGIGELSLTTWCTEERL